MDAQTPSLADIAVAVFVLFVGMLSLIAAISLSLQSTRNDGKFLHALIGKLAVWGVWGTFVAVEVFAGKHWQNIDRLLLSIPHLIILLWVFYLPKKRRRDTD